MSTLVSGQPVGRRQRGWLFRPRSWLVLVVLLGMVGIGGFWLIASSADAPLATLTLPSKDSAGGIAIDANLGRAFVVGGGPTSHLTLLDTVQGHLGATWSVPGLFLDVAVSRAAGHAFILSDTSTSVRPSPGTLTTVDTRTGAVIHVSSLPSNPTKLAVDEQGQRIFVVSQGPRKSDGVTVVGAGIVSVIDARSGVVVRHVPAGVRPWAIVVASRARRVFVLNEVTVNGSGPVRGTTSAFDADSGKAVATIPVGLDPSALTVDERTGRVFVANATGRSISVLDARTGMLRRTVALPASSEALAVDARAGRVVVAQVGSTGVVSILDATSGVLLHTIAMGGGPSSVAVNTRTGRAFVAGTGTPQSVWWRRSGLGSLPPIDQYDNRFVSVLDTRNGTLLHTIRTGSSTSEGVVADERSGRAFVVSPSNNTVSMLDATR